MGILERTVGREGQVFYLIRPFDSCFTRRTYRHAFSLGLLSGHASITFRRTPLRKIGVRRLLFDD